MMKSSLVYHLESKPEISGLTYIPEFISAHEQDFLLSQIDQQSWLTDLKRRAQHYGYKYDYKARNVSKDSYLGPLPDWLSSLSKTLHDDRIFPSVPDQVIVNEYLPGEPPPINESISGVNPDKIWIIYRRHINGKEALYG